QPRRIRGTTRIHAPFGRWDPAPLISTLGTASTAGVPFLAPDVQLYYKAKAPRPKDEGDFDTVLPLLTKRQRRWLVEALTKTYGPHPWTKRLEA
ncbi:hypothetical protein ACFU5X_12320, partial [Streptomyces platensis]